jgi:hypothetical protein
MKKTIISGQPDSLQAPNNGTKWRGQSQAHQAVQFFLLRYLATPALRRFEFRTSQQN